MTAIRNNFKQYHIVDSETGRVIDTFFHANVAREWLGKYKKTLMISLEIKKVNEDD